MSKLSLQEQLLKSGLVTSGQARAAKSEKHKQLKQQQHNKVSVADDSKAQAEKARLERIERDRELNRQRQLEDERKQLAAQIKQLVKENRLPRQSGLSGISDDDVAYHFIDDNKVKTLYMAKEIHEKLAGGQLAIAKLGKNYEIIPRDIAEKIQLRDASRIIGLTTQSQVNDAQSEDPYGQYQVPDDLMW